MRRAIEFAFGLQRQQRLLDAAQRHRAVHRVLGHRIGFEVQRLRARQHHRVVVRLVAVAIDQHDVAGRKQRLQHDLVRGRGAVGDEVDVVRAEGARRHFLRALDVAGGLQQAVQPAAGRRRLGHEQVDPVELRHVADPVRAEDGLAARHRQRMERADRLAAVAFEVVEVGRLVALADAVQHGEVNFHHLLATVENSAAAPRPRGARRAIPARAR